MAKNPFTRVGRPPASVKSPRGPARGVKTPAVAASPMAGFDGAIPGTAFRKGGGVHYDDARMAKCHSEHGFASAVDHKRRLRGKEC